MELNLIADVGLVGQPNAGKSTLLAALTNARPKVAPYPFTTRSPYLGVLRNGDSELLLADIPGIIAGASTGAGLGLRFLKHVNRTRALAFLIDLGEAEPGAALQVLRSELAAYDPALLSRPRLVVGTKLDLPDSATPAGAGARGRGGAGPGKFGLERAGAEGPGPGTGRAGQIMRLAILGGTFNPVHIGHLFLAEEVQALLGYDRILFVPANIPVHKTMPVEVGARHRLRMLHALAVAGCPGLVEDCELERGGNSYTIDTLSYVLERFRPEGRPGLIIGEDLVEGFPAWRQAAASRS